MQMSNRNMWPLIFYSERKLIEKKRKFKKQFINLFARSIWNKRS